MLYLESHCCLVWRGSREEAALSLLRDRKEVGEPRKNSLEFCIAFVTSEPAKDEYEVGKAKCEDEGSDVPKFVGLLA